MYLIGLSLSAAVGLHCESAVRQSASTCNACCRADRTGLSRCTCPRSADATLKVILTESDGHQLSHNIWCMAGAKSLRL